MKPRKCWRSFYNTLSCWRSPNSVPFLDHTKDKYLHHCFRNKCAKFTLINLDQNVFVWLVSFLFCQKNATLLELFCLIIRTMFIRFLPTYENIKNKYGLRLCCMFCIHNKWSECSTGARLSDIKFRSWNKIKFITKTPLFSSF